MENNQEFRHRILETFKAEARENVAIMSSCLLALEKQPGEDETEVLFEKLYRAAHSMKGAARAIELSEIESLCHAFEDVMSAIRDNEIVFNTNVFDILYLSVDLVELLLSNIGENTEESFGEIISEVIENLLLAEAGIEAEIPVLPKKEETRQTATVEERPKAIHHPSPNAPEEVKIQKGINIPQTKESITSKNSEDTIRVSSSKLINLLTKTEELLSLKISAGQLNEILHQLNQKIHLWNQKATKFSMELKSAQTGSPCGNSMEKVQSFCSWSMEYLKMLEKDLNDVLKSSSNEQQSIDLKVDNVLDDVRELIAIPFTTLFEGTPKMVRDISKTLNKKINLAIQGEETKIDRRIIEKLKNPIIHLIRNAIDYGIEPPEVRIQKGKNESGNINITIEQLDNGKVSMIFKDDGAGINVEKIRAKYGAIEQVADDALANIPKEEILKYIFKSGVSTSDIVTDLSGRGLGMAIVEDAIDELGGTITVESEPEEYTLFRLIIPMNIVTFRGIVVECSGRNFIIPTARVNRVIRIRREEVLKVGNKPNLKLGDGLIPLHQLNEILALPLTESSEYLLIVVAEIKGKKAGFIVDSIDDEQELLVKPLNRQLSGVQNILGATILGSGEVVPILNIYDMINAEQTHGISNTTKVTDDAQKQQKHILIVEDSITSRTLLKNILEAAGYKVTTAVDGVDGYTKLKEGDFHLVVTDVEMPRMDGFQLTEKIRSDKKYGEIPIVLVTSLSKRAHKEKGIDVGANAYIVKSSFNQTTLIETLERLII